MTEAGRFEFVDEVTSDLAVQLDGPSLESVFEAAAQALLAATLENPGAVRSRQTRELRLREHDLGLLLLRFLNELIYLRDAERLLLRASQLSIRRNGETELTACLEGEPMDAARHELAGEVKATTAHGLQVEERPWGWRARVTFDV
jgi:SHS2 domain-containing protein